MLNTNWQLSTCSAALLAIMLSPVALPAQTYHPTGDASISASSPSANFGAGTSMTVGGGFAALVQFDLSKLIALNVTSPQIQQATLTVFVNRVQVAGGLDLAPLTTSWSENTVTFNSAPIIGAPAQFNVATPGTSNGYVTFDITNLVRAWVMVPSTNNGVEITAATAQPATSVLLDTKESATTSHPPFVDVVLSATGPAGPTGATGTAGVRGATGSTGPIGPAGVQLSPWAYVSTTLAAQTAAQFVAECGVGNLAVSGGCGRFTLDGNITNARVFYSGPNPDNSTQWYCIFGNLGVATISVNFSVLCQPGGANASSNAIVRPAFRTHMVKLDPAQK